MATGPGGGSRQIGGAHVTLTIDDRQYWAKLQQANIGLQKFATAARQALSAISFARLSAQIAQVSSQVAQLGRNVDAVTQRFRAMNRVLQSATVNAQALSRAVNSIGATNISAFGTLLSRAFGGFGTGVGNVFRGLGAGLSTVAQGFGTAMRSVLRGVDPAVRGLGIGLGAVARGFGSLISQSVRAVGSVLTGLIGRFTSMLRGLFSLRLPGLGSLGSLGQLGAITVGVAGGFSLLYIHRQIVDMERELTRLRRTTGATAAEIQQLSRSFNDMGTTLAGVDLNKILELAVMGARLGVPREQLNLFTRDLSKVAAVLEDIPIDEAATRFSGLISVFELQYTDTIKLASALNALDISSNAAARDILDIAGRMSGAASTIGMTAQQTLALATAMRQARVPIETAGTAMGQILGRMTGRDLPEFARLAGMSARAFQQLLGQDALAALVKVEQGLGRLGAIERFRALDQLHLDGQRVRLVMLQLVPVLDELGKYLGIANEEWRTTNSIVAGFRLQAETASAMFARMWNNVQLLSVSMGTFLLPVMKGVADAIGNLSADVRAWIEGSGTQLRDWGRQAASSLEALGAVFRVLRTNGRDIQQILGATFRDLWGQFRANAAAAFGNVVKVGANAIDQLASYITTALPQAISNAMTTAIAGVMGKLPPGLVQFLTGRNAAFFQQQARNLPPVAGAGQFLNLQNLGRGMQPMPGFRNPGMLGMIGGLMGNAAAAQKGERLQREAAGILGDWVVRFMAGRGGRQGADAGVGRLAALAAMQDAGEGAGGLPGGAGGGGWFGGPGQAMAGGGMGGVRRPLGPDPIGANRMALGMVGLGFGGMVNNPHLRRIELDAWRARMGMRRPGRVNLMEMMGAQNPLLMGRRQFNQDRMARMALQRQHRMDLLRRNENRLLGRDPRRLDWRQRQIDMMQRRMGLPRAWLGALPDAAMRAAEQANRAAGVREWGETAVGRVIGLLEKIEQRIGIPLID